MKTVKQINHWRIKEKRMEEIPLGVKEEHRFCVFSPDGRCMEDGLLEEEAEKWCQENRDYVNR